MKWIKKAFGGLVVLYVGSKVIHEIGTDLLAEKIRNREKLTIRDRIMLILSPSVWFKV